MKSRKLSQWQYYTKSNLITIRRAAYQKELGVFYYKTINLVKIFLYFVNTSKGNIKENKWVFYNLYLLQFGSYVFHQGNHWIIFFMHKFFSHFRDKKNETSSSRLCYSRHLLQPCQPFFSIIVNYERMWLCTPKF